MSFPKYVKKPIPVEVMKWTGHNFDDIKLFCPFAQMRSGRLIIPTLEGEMTASEGDYIIKGIAGEFYPCKASIFNSTYQPA